MVVKFTRQPELYMYCVAMWLLRRPRLNEHFTLSHLIRVCMGFIIIVIKILAITAER